VGYGEYNQRHLLGRWADYLERPAGPPPQVQVSAANATAGRS
jgi:hypothetical protein